MSRIYDALRKAEEEKQGMVEVSPVLHEPAERRIEHLESVPAVAIETVETVNWNPDLNRLPVLMGFDAGAEEFRRLRARIYQYHDTSPLKSLLITSGLPSEGKSFIASNLAISLARHADCRVLLIDGDLRKPTLHSILGAPSLPGLSDYLAGQATLTQIVQRGSIANLSFIPAGTVLEGAAELSGNNNIDNLIAALSGEFEWIIVDSSPVVPVSDAVNLARACDGVLLVARAAATPYDIAQKALKEFKNSRVIGFVLNAVANVKVGKGYGHYYGDKLKYQTPALTKARTAGAD